MTSLRLEIAAAWSLSLGDVRGELLPDTTAPLMPQELQQFRELFLARICRLLDAREVARQ